MAFRDFSLSTSRVDKMIQYAAALTMMQDSTKEGPIYTVGRERECCGQIFWKCCNGAAGLHNRFDNRYPATGTGLQVNSANFFTQGKWRSERGTYCDDLISH